MRPGFIARDPDIHGRRAEVAILEARLAHVEDWITGMPSGSVVAAFTEPPTDRPCPCCGHSGGVA